MREQLAGVAAVSDALASDRPPRLILHLRDHDDPEAAAVCARARRLGVAVELISGNDLRRMSRVVPVPPMLALRGPSPDADRAELLRREGLIWALVGVSYAGNAGYAIRSAEVSGAAGIVLDDDVSSAERHRALRFSMHAERFFPVLWEPVAEVLEEARRVGRRVVAIEDVGARAPWETDLRGSPLVMIGGERDGIPAALLERCDEVVRIPMRGFIPAYNLQAAMAIVAGERLRQEG